MLVSQRGCQLFVMDLKSCTQSKINSWKEDDHHIGYKLKFFEKKHQSRDCFLGKVSPNDDYFSSNWRNFSVV